MSCLYTNIDVIKLCLEKVFVQCKAKMSNYKRVGKFRL